MQFGIDRLLQDAHLRGALAGRRIGLVAHPASVTTDLDPTLDAGWASISAACSSGRSRSRGSPLADALTGAEPLHVG